jgi:hypothetical protein
MTRLNAYRLGVADYIQKPFTDEELAIRVRRAARSGRGASERVVLRGEVTTISLGTLLSLLDFERKSGTLVVLSDAQIARIFFAAGRIVKVETSLPAATPREKLMAVLDWRTGNFEFSACEVVGEDEIDMPTQALLLEHARTRDEQQQGEPPSVAADHHGPSVDVDLEEEA